MKSYSPSVAPRGINESSYSNSTRKILEFDSELIDSRSSLSSLSSQVQISQYSTRAAR